MRKRGLSILIVSGLLAVGGLAGCSTNSDHSSSAAAKPAIAPAAAGGSGSGGTDAGGQVSGGAAGSTNGSTASKAAPETTLVPADVTRSVVYNGSITVRVASVDAAANGAEALATGSGGYVGGDDRTLDGGRSTATLTLRVPADQFDATVSALGQLGKEQSRHVSAQDVTSQVVDVQSRLATQQASVDRIRQLIAKTTTINEIVALEDELTQREADLESMEAQLRSLTDLASLSTITVVLIGPDAEVAPAPVKKPTGFLGGLRSGWSSFTHAGGVLLTVIGAVLPYAVVVGVLIAIWVFVRRRRTRTAAAVVAVSPGGDE